MDTMALENITREIAQTATERLFARHWEGNQTSLARHTQAISECILQLAGTLNEPVTPEMVKGYIAALTDLTPAQCVLAFSRCLETCRYFPKPVELRDAAGISNPQTELRRRAKMAAREVFEVVRRHGAELKPIPGAIKNDGKDAEGRVLQVPEREPDIKPKPFAHEVNAAIYRFGGNSFEDGMRMFEHWIECIVSKDPFIAKQAQQYEKGWIDCYVWTQERAA